MTKLYEATAKTYPKKKGVASQRFRPDPEKSLADQLVVWNDRMEGLAEESVMRKRNAKEKPRPRVGARERAGLNTTLGPYWQ
jgi:hypothetical protein